MKDLQQIIDDAPEGAVLFREQSEGLPTKYLLEHPHFGLVCERGYEYTGNNAKQVRSLADIKQILELQEQVKELVALLGTGHIELKWLEVDGYENIPEGRWEVAIEKHDGRVVTHIMEKSENISVIGHHFAHDERKVFKYRPVGKPPTN